MTGTRGGELDTNSRDKIDNMTSRADSVATSRELASDATESSVFLRDAVRAGRRQLVVPVLVLSDLVLAIMFWGLALFLCGLLRTLPLSEAVFFLIVSNTIAWLLVRALLGLYPGYGLSPAEELRRQTYAAAATLTLTVLLAFGAQVSHVLPVLLIALDFLERLLLGPLGRYLVKSGLRKTGLWGKPVVVLGASGYGQQLVRALKKEWGLGFRPVSVFDFPVVRHDKVLERTFSRGAMNESKIVARSQRVDTIIFAMPHIRRKNVAKFISMADRHFRNVLVIPNLLGITTSVVSARDLGGTVAVEVKDNLLDPWARRTKRALDLVCVVVGGLLISPLLLGIAITIKLTSPGSIFYKQMRLGAEGKHFFCWKFRTMRPNAARILTQLLQSDPSLRKEWEEEHKLHNDPRITPIGRFLRMTSLDELPQIWNVLRGEMSLVGPRPIVDAEIPKYGEVYQLYRRVGPGMTGLWQVSGRSETTYEERVTLDAYYVRNWSVWLDFAVLARTLNTLIFRAGAY